VGRPPGGGQYTPDRHRSAPAGIVIGRIVRSADFERVLAAPTRARTAHFAVHHVDARPSLAAPAAARPLSSELSTAGAPDRGASVDDSAPKALWLGAVVPKRHARHAVTRTLLKRQIRAAMQRRSDLPGGLWVVRVRAPFDRVAFVSAASDALRQAATTELDTLLAHAARRTTAA
jgi:ribonuclease P protein component